MNELIVGRLAVKPERPQELEQYGKSNTRARTPTSMNNNQRTANSEQQIANHKRYAVTTNSLRSRALYSMSSGVFRFKLLLCRQISV